MGRNHSLLLSLLPLVMPAAAQATVMHWDYLADVQFADAKFAPIAGSSGAGTPTIGRHDLAWGSEGYVSRLAIRSPDGLLADAGAPTAGRLRTNGEFAPISRLYHDNRPVPLSSLALTKASLRIDLSVTPAGQATAASSINIAPLELSFRETPNLDPCESGSGDCDDIFIIASAAPFTDAFSYGFIFDAKRYFVDITSSGLGPLTAQQCAAAGAPTGCIGFLTPEDALSSSLLLLRIRADEVPEPAPIALCGLGLIALAGLRRSRAKLSMSSQRQNLDPQGGPTEGVRLQRQRT